MTTNGDIEFESDDVSKDYYIIWTPAGTIVGSGSTKIEALQDLREAAHFWVDSLIGLKLKEVIEEKENNEF